MYNSYTTVVLARSSDSTSNNGTLQSDVTTNQKLVSTYREIIKSRRILNQVISNLDLNMSYETLHNMVSVTNEKDTELIKIAVNSQNSKDAKDIANEIAKVFSKEIESIYEIKNLSIIDYADENCRFVRIVLMASAILDLGFVATINSFIIYFLLLN